MRERDLLDRLHERYSRRYANGPHKVLRYVGAAHVRYGPLWPKAIVDYLVQDTWGNYRDVPHPLLGFEVKVSRPDFLREVRDLGKSEPFRRVCSEWYIVAPSTDIVRDDLPRGWGLLVPYGAHLRVASPAHRNAHPDPLPRGLIAGFLRAVATQHAERAVAS